MENIAKIVCLYSILIFFDDFNKVIILHLWFLFIMYGFWLFLFLYKLHAHYDIFNSFFLYINAYHRQWFDPQYSCYLINYATLVFTPFEISKDPTFLRALFEMFWKLPIRIWKKMNYTKVRRNWPNNRLYFTPSIVHLYINKRFWQYFSQVF